MVSFSKRSVFLANALLLILCLLIELGMATSVMPTSVWYMDVTKRFPESDWFKDGFSAYPSVPFQVSMRDGEFRGWSLSGNFQETMGSDHVTIRDVSKDVGRSDFEVTLSREGLYSLTSTATDSKGKTHSFSRDVWVQNFFPSQIEVYAFKAPERLNEHQLRAAKGWKRFVGKTQSLTFTYGTQLRVYLDNLGPRNYWHVRMDDAVYRKDCVYLPKVSLKRLDFMEAVYEYDAPTDWDFKAVIPKDSSLKERPYHDQTDQIRTLSFKMRLYPVYGPEPPSDESL